MVRAWPELSIGSRFCSPRFFLPFVCMACKSTADIGASLFSRALLQQKRAGALVPALFLYLFLQKENH